MMRKIYLVFIIVFSSFISAAWSHETPQSTNAQQPLAEIDTTLWKYLSATDRSEWTITKEDSAKTIKDYVLPGATIFRKTTEIYNKITQERTTIEQEASNLISLLEDAKDYFEQGLRLNPFDNYIRPGLTTVYSRLEQLYAYKKETKKRLQILNNLLYLKTDPKDQLYLFNSIGMIYRGFEIWEQARDNFDLAVQAIFEVDEATVDSTKLFENIYLRGEAQLKLYEDQPALTSFTYAKMIAPNENLDAMLTNWIDFINWDGGNIRASERYRDARKLYTEKKYDESEKLFLELLKIVTTESATNQAQLTLARMQFYQLDKKDEAVDRLWNVVNRYPLNSTSGVPIDSSYQNIWTEYSQMCLRMGVSNFTTDKRSSFTYFLKSSQIESPARGKALLNLAMMSSLNPQICLNYCTRALDYQQQLNNEEKKFLFETIYQAYLKQGNFEEALKWFKKFHEMTS